MKKVLFFLIIILILGLSPGMAADLQAGWYATVSSIGVYTYSSEWGPVTAATFGSSPGEYGPYLITYLPEYYDSITISVPNAVSGLPGGVAVEIPIELWLAPYDYVSHFSISYRTSYDPSQMRLQLGRRDPATGSLAIFWEQTTAGYPVVGGAIASAGWVPATTGYVLRVSTVPEPSSLLGMATLAVLGLGLRRRRQG